MQQYSAAIRAAATLIVCVAAFHATADIGAEDAPADSLGSRGASDWKTKAVIVGVGEYDYYINLPNAVNDAKELANTLVNNGQLFDGEDLVLMTSSSESKEGLRDDILSKLTWLKRGSPDYVLFYFAGHGLEKKGELYLMCPGTRRDLPELSSVPFSAIKSAIKESGATLSMIILDTCHAGAGEAREGEAKEEMTEGMETALVQLADEEKNDLSQGCIVLASCRANEESREYDNQHGLFTHFLIKALDGDGDDNHDGLITGKETGEYTSTKVASYSKQQQNPRLISDVTGSIPLAKYVGHVEITLDKSVKVPAVVTINKQKQPNMVKPGDKNGQRYDVRPPEAHIVLSAPGYQEKEWENFRITRNRLEPIYAKLEPKPGTLNVSVSIEEDNEVDIEIKRGETLLQNGKCEKGQTFTSKPLSPGPVTVTASATGYTNVPKGSEIVSDEVAEVSLALERAFNDLSVTVNNTDAKISVLASGENKWRNESAKKGKPCLFSHLPTGEAVLTINNTGYEMFSKRQPIEPGPPQPQELLFDLTPKPVKAKPATGKLKVEIKGVEGIDVTVKVGEDTKTASVDNPEEYELPPGEVSVEIVEVPEGYQVDETSKPAKITADKTETVSFTLEKKPPPPPQTGSLVVKVVADESVTATVEVNGEKRGTAPGGGSATVPGLTAGEVNVTVSAEGYEKWEDKVTVKAGSDPTPVEAKLVRLKGNLKVTVNVPAKISVVLADGAEVEKGKDTPQRLFELKDLAAGEATVTVSAEGLENKKRVTIPANKWAELAFEFEPKVVEPKTATLTVRVKISDNNKEASTTITVNGDEKGKASPGAPLKVPDLPVGGIVEVMVSADQYRPQTLDVELEPGDAPSNDRTFELERETGSVKVRLDIEGDEDVTAEVQVTGKAARTVTRQDDPAVFEDLYAGQDVSVSVSVPEDWKKPEDQFVTVIADKTQTVPFTLEKEPPPPPATGTLIVQIEANDDVEVVVTVGGKQMDTPASRNSPFTVPDLPVGTVTVSISAPEGYKVDQASQTVTITAGETRVPFTLEKEPPVASETGTLVVEVINVPADIMVRFSDNRLEEGKAGPGEPFRLDDLPPNNVTIKASAEGYKEQSKTESIRAGEETKVSWTLEEKPQPIHSTNGVLKIMLETKGDVEIYVNNEKWGSVSSDDPLEREVEEGEVALKASKRNSKVSRTITIKAGMKTTISLDPRKWPKGDDAGKGGGGTVGGVRVSDPEPL